MDDQKQSIQWSRHKILLTLIALEKKNENLATRAIRKSNPGLYAAARRHFGSWGLALAATGIKLSITRGKQTNQSNQTRWTRDAVIEAILECVINRQPLLSSKIRPASLRIAAARVFGSWDKALCAAGVRQFSNTYQKWSKDRIKKELLKRLKDKKSIYLSDILADSPKLRSAIGRRFGRWSEAFLYAGICPGMIEKSRKQCKV